MYEKELQNLINEYKKEFETFEQNNKEITEDKINDYNNKKLLSNGKCTTCGASLIIENIENESNDFIKYTFKCGHKHNLVYCVDLLNVKEGMLEGKIKNGIFGKVATTLERIFRINKPSKDKKKHPENVDEEMIIDKRDKDNKTWYHKITDRKTGIITHEETQKLDDHK